MPPKGYKKNNPKKILNFRIGDETEKHLEEVSKETKQTKSNVIRKGIEIQYKELKTKK